MTTYRFAQVLQALMRLHGVPNSKGEAVKSRLANFARLGIAPSHPGKGQRRDYAVSDVFPWALALEFACIGVEPHATVRFLRNVVLPMLPAKIEGAAHSLPEQVAFRLNLFGDLELVADHRQCVGFGVINLRKAWSALVETLSAEDAQ